MLQRMPRSLSLAVAAPAVALLLGLSPAGVQPGFDAYDVLLAERAGRVLMVVSDDPEPVEEVAEPYAFARVGGTELLTPTPLPLLVGFHQASGRAPVALEPVGERITPDDLDAAATGTYAILPSRGRGTSPTSAVDIVVPPDEQVLAPVTGKVVSVSRYTLYASMTDIVIVIAPDDAPGMLVKVLHVDEAEVAVGDPVVAGRTPIAARGRALPFSSQVDRIVGERLPHVHIEVIRGG